MQALEHAEAERGAADPTTGQRQADDGVGIGRARSRRGTATIRDLAKLRFANDREGGDAVGTLHRQRIRSKALLSRNLSNPPLSGRASKRESRPRISQGLAKSL